jgi:hypothetical protein
MPGKARLEARGVLYHIIIRGIERRKRGKLKFEKGIEKQS